MEYNARSHTLLLRSPQADTLPKQERLPGSICVVSGGTADLAVAEECKVTAEHLGCYCFRITDVSVSELGKLLQNLDALRAADALVVVCGTDAALPSVLAGLVDVPVVSLDCLWWMLYSLCRALHSFKHSREAWMWVRRLIINTSNRLMSLISISCIKIPINFVKLVANIPATGQCLPTQPVRDSGCQGRPGSGGIDATILSYKQVLLSGPNSDGPDCMQMVCVGSEEGDVEAGNLVVALYQPTTAQAQYG